MDDSRIYLFVLDRGFVVVGRAGISDELVHHWLLKPGRTVRQWGTERGLTQLCQGPTSSTVLDPPAERLIPFRSIIEIIKVDEAKWESHLTWNESSSAPAPRTRSAGSPTRTG